MPSSNHLSPTRWMSGWAAHRIAWSLAYVIMGLAFEWKSRNTFLSAFTAPTLPGAKPLADWGWGCTLRRRLSKGTREKSRWRVNWEKGQPSQSNGPSPKRVKQQAITSVDSSDCGGSTERQWTRGGAQP